MAVDRGHEGLSKKNYRTYSKLYRDPAAFEVVEDEVLWELGKEALERTGEQTVEAWSCGCSAGEEVFSLLMSWEQVLAEHFPGVDLRFLGTDVSHSAIEAAQRAEYGPHAVQDVPEAWLERCFDVGQDEQHRQTYMVQPRLKHHATFVQQDVREKLPNKTFDLVTCRYSVFLYCSRDECARFLQELVGFGCLRPGGFLFVGQPDELPVGWRSLGLQEWRGHQGLYRVAEGIHPMAPRPDNVRSVHGSLRDFLGVSVRRPASERIGRPEEEKEELKLTAEQMAQNLERFDKWHQKQGERAAQLRAEALHKEKAEIAPPVFISQKKVDAFAQRMQDEAARRERKLKIIQEQVHGVERKKKEKKIRKVAVGRRQKKSQSHPPNAVLQRATQARALWVARARTKADRTAGAWGSPRACVASSSNKTQPSDRLRHPEEPSGASRRAISARDSRLLTEVEARRRRTLALRSGTPITSHDDRVRRLDEFKIRLEAQEQARIHQIKAAQNSDGKDSMVPLEASVGSAECLVPQEQARSTHRHVSGTDKVVEVSQNSEPVRTSPMTPQTDVDAAPLSFSSNRSTFSPIGSALKIMVAAPPSEHKLSKQQQLEAAKKEALRVELMHANGWTTDAAVSSVAAATAGIGTLRHAVDNKQGTLELPTAAAVEPYLRAVIGRGEGLRPGGHASGTECVACTTPVPPSKQDNRCSDLGWNHPAAAASDEGVALLEGCVTVQASNVPSCPESQAQPTTTSKDATVLCIGFGKGDIHRSVAQMQHHHAMKKQRSSSRVEGKHCGQAVATVFSAAKRYSAEALQRCSNVARLAPASAKELAAARGCIGSFEQEWVNTVAAQPRLVTGSTGRRRWVRGW